MLFVLYFWIALSFLLMFIKPHWGIAVYLPFYILVPFFNMTYFNYPILLALIYHSTSRKIDVDWKLYSPFFIFFVAFLILIPFQDGLDLSKQFNYWRLDVVGMLTFPLFINLVLKSAPNSITLFRNVLIGCIIVAALYGLFLTRLDGINPYLLYMSDLSGSGNKDSIISYSIAKGSGRLFGRIYSCFQHPMLYAFFLGLSIIYIYNNRLKLNKFLLLFLFLILLLNIIFCGVRSVVGGLVISAGFYLLFSRNYKSLIYLVISYVVYYFIFRHIQYLNEYLFSFVNDQNSNIRGSSLELRTDQFEGCLKEIKNDLLFGKGYGWTANYLTQKGDHPTMLAFESLIFSLLCNAGFAGVFIWSRFFLLFSKVNYKYMDSSLIYISLLVYYVSFSIITGDYSYMKLFILFYTLMIGDDQLYSRRFNLSRFTVAVSKLTMKKN